MPFLMLDRQQDENGLLREFARWLRKQPLPVAETQLGSGCVDESSYQGYDWMHRSDVMRGIATKELKNRLSFYLRLVRSGASFVVTDRGRPVAQLGPFEKESGARDAERAWVEAAAKGQVSLPRGKGFAKFRPIRMRKRKKLSDAVLEDRR